MTREIAPYVLLGMAAVWLVGGVSLLAHAAKTWLMEIGDRDQLAANALTSKAPKG